MLLEVGELGLQQEDEVHLVVKVVGIGLGRYLGCFFEPGRERERSRQTSIRLSLSTDLQ